MYQTAFDLISESYKITEFNKYEFCGKHLNSIRIVLQNLLPLFKNKTNSNLIEELVEGNQSLFHFVILWEILLVMTKV